MNNLRARQIFENIQKDGILSSEEQEAFRYLLDQIQSLEEKNFEYTHSKEPFIDDNLIKIIPKTSSIEQAYRPCHDTCRYLRVEHDAWGSRFYVCTKHYKQLAESTLAYNYCDSYEKKEEK